MKNSVPTCGSSDQRNQEYSSNYSPERYYKSLVQTSSPVIFDVGAHRGESVKFFKEIFPNSSIYSFEPDLENFKELEICCQTYTSGGCFAVNMGVAEKEEEFLFYRQSISHLNSLLPINNNSEDSLGYAATYPLHNHWNVR